VPEAERAEVLNGTTQELAVALERRAGFDGPVFLRLDLTPEGQGVRARLLEKTIEPPPAAQKAVVLVTVSETAPPGDYTVALLGRSESGVEAKAEIVVRVPKRE
jgi:uncharacterized membrane protein